MQNQNFPNVVTNPISISWYSYPLLYAELTGKAIDASALLQAFVSIPIPPSTTVIDSAAKADQFFETYGVGNDLTKIDRPFERFHAYELLLATIAGHDKNKYNTLHKGTPYYFLGWTAFQIENYEKGIYYFDQAIAEDIRKSETTDMNIIKNNPAVKSLLLDPQAMPAAITSLELRAEMDAAFERFSRGSNLKIDANTFVNNFILGSGEFLNTSFRTIITSIYSFVLEYHTLVTAMNLRSINDSSLEPFFLHLFKGGLLLESVLKLKYPEVKTLYPAISRGNNNLQIDMAVLKGGTLEELIQHLDSLVANKASFQNLAFATAYGIRNTTGHNLAWSNVFQNDSKIYERLFTFTMHAILWAIFQLWIQA